MLTLAMPEATNAANTRNGFVLLTGTVQSPGDAAEAEQLVQAFVGDDTKVLSRLRTATPLQVNLQVRIAEVNRSLLKEINGNLLTSDRSEEHTSELQSLMRISYAVFCLKKQNNNKKLCNVINKHNPKI